MTRQLDALQQIERSMIKKYRKKLWSPFMTAVTRYQLIQPNDKIAVCISGGKDSMVLAKLMQQLQKHSLVPFELVYLVMDPGYNPANRQNIEKNAELLGIDLTIFETNIFDVVSKIDQSPCYLCARMRRGYLYKNAQRLGCNKIALGHHFSDVIETTLMGLMYGGQFQTMMPKLHSTNFAGMQLIRPMYCVHEDSIIAFRDYHGLQFIQCACHFTENCTVDENGTSESKRQEIKLLIKKLAKDNPFLEQNIFNSIHNVNLRTIIGYTQNNVEYSFLDRFDQEAEEITKSLQK